jgi:hypothetical protein
MRYKLIALIVSVMIAPLTLDAAAAKSRARQHAITVNPLGLAFGLGNLTYEQAINKQNSWLAGASFANWGIAGNSISVIGALASYRWWFENDKPISGWFLGPELQVVNVNWNYSVLNKDYTANGLMFGGGGQGGYQWVFNSGFTLNLGLSMGYLAGSVSSNVAGAPTLGFGGTYVSGNLGLGVAF